MLATPPHLPSLHSGTGQDSVIAGLRLPLYCVIVWQWCKLATTEDEAHISTENAGGNDIDLCETMAAAAADGSLASTSETT